MLEISQILVLKELTVYNPASDLVNHGAEYPQPKSLNAEHTEGAETAD